MFLMLVMTGFNTATVSTNKEFLVPRVNLLRLWRQSLVHRNPNTTLQALFVTSRSGCLLLCPRGGFPPPPMQTPAIPQRIKPLIYSIQSQLGAHFPWERIWFCIHWGRISAGGKSLFCLLCENANQDWKHVHSKRMLQHDSLLVKNALTPHKAFVFTDLTAIKQRWVCFFQLCLMATHCSRLGKLSHSTTEGCSPGDVKKERMSLVKSWQWELTLLLQPDHTASNLLGGIIQDWLFCLKIFELDLFIYLAINVMTNSCFFSPVSLQNLGSFCYTSRKPAQRWKNKNPLTARVSTDFWGDLCSVLLTLPSLKYLLP